MTLRKLKANTKFHTWLETDFIPYYKIRADVFLCHACKDYLSYGYSESQYSPYIDFIDNRIKDIVSGSISGGITLFDYLEAAFPYLESDSKEARIEFLRSLTYTGE